MSCAQEVCEGIVVTAEPERAGGPRSTGLRQDADVVVREMATWEAQLFQQGCARVGEHA